MGVIFALNHLGAGFQVKLADCIDMELFDVSDVVEQFIIFTKPNGKKVEKIAALVEDLPNFVGEFFVTYVNSSPEVTSILDQIGKWEFEGKVKLSNGDEFSTSQRSLFWVN